MKQLKVSLVYSASDYSGGKSRGSPLALPLRVLDAEGGLIAEGVAGGPHVAVFAIDDDVPIVFVRLTWPSGKAETQRVSLEGRANVDIAFTDATIARNEWSAWAVPRLNARSALARPEQGETPSADIDRYDRVWLRLWRFEAGLWSARHVTPTAQYRNQAARQIDLELDASPWLLQLGGLKVPWRLVSLPGGGSCRVLLTPTDSTDPRADPLKTIVTGFRSDAETLLEFLSRDALRAASSLAGYQPLAVDLLQDKAEDPVAAVAAAYFLLRTQGWNRIPLQWFDNLYYLFPWIPDTAVIRCVVATRSGLKDAHDEELARSALRECLARGLPVYAEGLTLLQEAAAVLRPATRHPQGLDDVFATIERLGASSAWAGSAFSFYGTAPDAPSPEKFIGMPNRSRPEKRAPLLPAGAGKAAPIVRAGPGPTARAGPAADDPSLMYLGRIGN